MAGTLSFPYTPPPVANSSPTVVGSLIFPGPPSVPLIKNSVVFTRCLCCGCLVGETVPLSVTRLIAFFTKSLASTNDLFVSAA